MLELKSLNFKHKIVKEIDRGAYGIVYLVKNVNTNAE